MRISRLLVGIGIAVTLPMTLGRRVRRVEVLGQSMVPTLQPGDRVLVMRRRPRPGDLVAVRDPRLHERVLVKRLAEVAPAGLVVLGDNPAASTDSRTFGPVGHGLVVGVAVYRYFPAARAGRVRRGPVRSTRWTMPASTPSSPPTT